MITLQCCECGHLWQCEGGDCGEARLPCPQCGADRHLRVGKRHGRRARRRAAARAETRRLQQTAQATWQRTAPRAQAHKGRGRG